ncbi:hypothetical protein R3P38DRAFT_3232471 [Favolaschia claudopus]|uniref:Uncharacterized protein n=1 Tax=Favolaschia claudopus TaxID=2862362 RepID=A0AAV9ZJF5_9AGAR
MQAFVSSDLECVRGELPGRFGTATTVVIQYERNTTIKDCPENTALDDDLMNPLDTSITAKIIERHTALLKPNRRIILNFASCADGQFTAHYCNDEPMGHANVLTNAGFPSMLLSSLRWTHRFLAGHPMYLVTLSDDAGVIWVSKEAADFAPVPNVSFFAGLPSTDVKARMGVRYRRGNCFPTLV